MTRRGTAGASDERPLGDREAYVARAEFMPLVMLADKAETPSQGDPGGSCLRLVARGRFTRCIRNTGFRLRFMSGPKATSLNLDFAPRGETAPRAEPRERCAARDSGWHSKNRLAGTLPPYPQIEYS